MTIARSLSRNIRDERTHPKIINLQSRGLATGYAKQIAYPTIRPALSDAGRAIILIRRDQSCGRRPRKAYSQDTSDNGYDVAEHASSHTSLCPQRDDDACQNPDAFASTRRHANESSVPFAEAKVADDLASEVCYASIADVRTADLLLVLLCSFGQRLAYLRTARKKR